MVISLKTTFINTFKVYSVYLDEFHKGVLFKRVVKMQNEILINGFSMSLMYVIFIFIWYWLNLRSLLTYKNCLCFYYYFLKLDYNFWNCNLYTLTFVLHVCFWSHIFYAIDILFHNASRLRMTRHIFEITYANTYWHFNYNWFEYFMNFFYYMITAVHVINWFLELTPLETLTPYSFY